jgi:hypothetical protein
MRCLREATSLLSRLISLGGTAHQYAIDAGLKDWIKESRIAGYGTLFGEPENEEGVEVEIDALRGARGARGEENERQAEETRLGEPITGATLEAGDALFAALT